MRRIFVRVPGWAVLGLVLLVGREPQAGAADLTAQQIVDKLLDNNAFGFQNARARVTLRLLTKSGVERIRNIDIRSRQQKGLAKTLVRFNAPADVAGTGFLVIENEGREDDQFLYMPALGKVKRVAGNQRSQRFMGTDLTYSDLESNSLKRGALKRLPDEVVSGSPSYVIESTPKEASASEYGKTITWVHTASFVPLKIEFYDKELKLLKVLTVRRLEKKDNHWVVMESTIRNQQEGTETRMQVDEIDFKVKLDDAVFTERALASG